MMSALRPRANVNVERAALTTCVVLLSAGAWVSMGLAGEADFLSHHHFSHPSADGPPFLLFFLAGWIVMTVAMMLPTALPILATVHSLASSRADRWRLISITVGGYLLVWAFFGLLAYGGYFAWQHAVAGNSWLSQHALPTSAVLLLVAGGFQFSSLKYKCLDKCRSPFSFAMQYWTGHRERWQVFRLGFDHGLFCVGCCWALMLLMFVVGVGNLLWMFLLAVVMAVEKNVRWGRRLSIPLGVVLVIGGIVSLLIP